MSDRLGVHALWAGAVMYAVALICYALVAVVRHAHALPPDPADMLAAKGMALFGPIVSVVGIVLCRRGDHQGGKGGAT